MVWNQNVFTVSTVCVVILHKEFSGRGQKSEISEVQFTWKSMTGGGLGSDCVCAFLRVPALTGEVHPGPMAPGLQSLRFWLALRHAASYRFSVQRWRNTAVINITPVDPHLLSERWAYMSFHKSILVTLRDMYFDCHSHCVFEGAERDLTRSFVQYLGDWEAVGEDSNPQVCQTEARVLVP